VNRGSIDNPFWSVGEAIKHINGAELTTVVVKGGYYVGPQNVNLTFTGLNIAFVYVYNKYHSAESVKESLPFAVLALVLTRPCLTAAIPIKDGRYIRVR
jgi:hypothetical protein